VKKVCHRGVADLYNGADNKETTMKGTKIYYRLSNIESHLLYDADPSHFTFTPNVTHVQVAMVPSEWGTGHIFDYFNQDGQGLANPGGQAKLKATPHLKHTSMSVGDVIVTEDNKAYVCDDIGWRELMRDNSTFQEVWK